MEKEIRTLNGSIKVHTFVEKHANNYETDSFKDFSLTMTDIAQQRKENIKAIVIKPDIHEAWMSYQISRYTDDELRNNLKDRYIFNKKILIDKDVADPRYYCSTIDDYKFIRRFKNCLPDNYKYIELETRRAVLEMLFPDGVEDIISDASSLLKDYYGFDNKVDECFFGKNILEHDVFACFHGSLFVVMYVLGYLLANLVDKGVKEVYFVNDYGNLDIYYDGINKKEIKQITESIIQKFNKDFFVQITLDNPGEKNFKYVPVEDSFAEDRFGNKMGIGDLVLSPQGSDNGGSWVDPIIVKSIQKDRIIPDVKDRSYYLADRCILLRSVHGVEPKYGDKDFLQGKD